MPNLKNDLIEVETLYDRYSNGELELYESYGMDEDIDNLRFEMMQKAKYMPLDELRQIVASEDWTWQTPLDEQEQDEDQFREEACDAMYEDFDKVLIAWKAMLGMPR